MWEYNHTDELYHYGVPGMRWGHRKIKRMESKQQDMLAKKQIGTNKYVNLSNKLYIAKKKQALRTAKKNKNSIDVQNLKYDIQEAKGAKKYGANVLDANRFKSVYKVKRSTKEGAAVSLASNKRADAKEITKNVLKKVGYVGIVGLATAPAWYPKVKKGMDFVSSVKLKTLKYDWKTGVVSAIRK